MPLPLFPWLTVGSSAPSKNRSFPAEVCLFSFTAAPHSVAVSCSISKCRNRVGVVLPSTSTSHRHRRAFVGLRLPFFSNDSFLFISKIYKFLCVLQLLLSIDFIYFSLLSCLILSHLAIKFSDLLPSLSPPPLSHLFFLPGVRHSLWWAAAAKVHREWKLLLALKCNHK